MNRKIIYLITLLLIISFAAESQAQNIAKLDSLFDTLLKNNKAMGSITISKKGNIVYSKAIGYSFIDNQEKIESTTGTKYRIGSITKMFTAVMILQLMEENKISLNETLEKYFPEIPNSKKITIANLLNHRSGIHNFTSEPDYLNWMVNPKTHQEMIDIISKNNSDFEPDSKMSYSNSNYILLGYILEKICKKPYSEILLERITSKLNLNDTYYGSKTDIKKNECYSYDFLNNWLKEPETDMSIPHGAGAIVSTPSDLTRFIEALFGGKMISQKSLDKMITMKDGYGLGIFPIPIGTKKAFGHNGGIDGFASMLLYSPEDSLAVAYCTNGQVYPVNDIMKGAIDIFYNKTYSIPTFKTLNLSNEELDQYLGTYKSKELPLKITISKNSKSLFAQAEGQSAFPLEATDKNVFKFDAAGIVMEFNPAKNEFILKQGGGRFLYTKE